MKLLLENWRQYLKENKSNIYYWQTQGPWEGDPAIGQHVPKAKPRPKDPLIEKIFEQVRQAQFPDRPSRLNCVFLCENLEGFAGGSFCYYPSSDEESETYVVQLVGNPKVFKTNAEYWTEAVMKSRYNKDTGGSDHETEAEIKRWAKAYWEGDNNPTFGEILVNPPEAAIIMKKYEE